MLKTIEPLQHNKSYYIYNMDFIEKINEIIETHNELVKDFTEHSHWVNEDSNSTSVAHFA